jgi:P2-related tail formation protein
MTGRAMSKLSVPGGIDDLSTRALVGLLDRWDDLPLANILTLRTASVPASALPHLAWQFGLEELGFLGGPPRTFVERAVALVRRFGTWGALRQALSAIGYDVTQLREGAQLSYDGSATYSGLPWRYGADSHYAKYWLLVTTTDAIATERVREVWDLAEQIAPKSRELALLMNLHDSGTEIYTARP